MEHICEDCGHTIINNVPKMFGCPKCDGRMTAYFDEDPADHDRDDEDWDEDDEDEEEDE